MLPKPVARYSAVLMLNFLLIYTGFGFFMGVVTIAVLIFDLRHAFQNGVESPSLSAVALLIALASLAGFFYHYRWIQLSPVFIFRTPIL